MQEFMCFTDSLFEAATPLLQPQTFYQENQFDNMSSLMHPSGNREKSPATCLFTLNNPVPEEVRDAPYTESENGQGICYNMTSRQNSKWMFLNEVLNQSPLKTTGDQVKLLLSICAISVFRVKFHVEFTRQVENFYI